MWLLHAVVATLVLGAPCFFCFTASSVPQRQQKWTSSRRKSTNSNSRSASSDGSVAPFRRKRRRGSVPLAHIDPEIDGECSSSSRSSRSDAMGRRGGEGDESSTSRRTFAKHLAAAAMMSVGVAGTTAGTVGTPAAAVAADDAPTEFVPFVDSRKLFSCMIPKRYVRDVRDGTKKGLVFVAGDFSRAETMSVSVISNKSLLEDAGVAAVGDLSSWQSLGSANALASLLGSRRDLDSNQPPSQVIKDSITLEGNTLRFLLETPVKVMRKDLLLEQQGVSELHRNTFCNAQQRGDGTFLVLWAGGGNVGWEGENGGESRLSTISNSFVATKVASGGDAL